LRASFRLQIGFAVGTVAGIDADSGTAEQIFSITVIAGDTLIRFGTLSRWCVDLSSPMYSVILASQEF